MISDSFYPPTANCPLSAPLLKELDAARVFACIDWICGKNLRSDIFLMDVSMGNEYKNFHLSVMGHKAPNKNFIVMAGGGGRLTDEEMVFVRLFGLCMMNMVQGSWIRGGYGAWDIESNFYLSETSGKLNFWSPPSRLSFCSAHERLNSYMYKQTCPDQKLWNRIEAALLVGLFVDFLRIPQGFLVHCSREDCAILGGLREP